MIFIAAAEPNVVLTAFGRTLALEPLTWPNINVNHILAMEGELGRRILKRNNGKVQMIEFDAHRLPDFPKPLPRDLRVATGSRVVLIRGGGIGDMLMCTPTIRALKKNLPGGIHLSLATFQDLCDLMCGNPFVDSVLAQPLTLGQLMGMDYYFEFKDPNSDIATIHMIDFYLKCAGFDASNVVDKSITLTINRRDKKDLSDRIQALRPDFGHIVYLNGLASDPIRDIPYGVLWAIADAFPKHLFLVPEMYTTRYPESAHGFRKRKNISPMDTAGDLTGYLTMIHCSDAVITTDSSAYHIAAAFDKPCMALFGPIDPGLRTAYYPTVRPIASTYSGGTCTAPCGKSNYAEFNDTRAEAEKRCPEAIRTGNGFSPCLSDFAMNRLIESLETTLNPCSRRNP